jgi:tetratricopeptide (TPR) repeat protein
MNTSFAQDIHTMLELNQISQIEQSLSSTQEKFERGALSEIDLRNGFSPFYKLGEKSAKNLVSWASNSPKSYVAHLALGIYYKNMGQDARGEETAVNTSQDNLRIMNDFYEKASKELNASLTLTQKPFLSVFHLLAISTQFGDKAASRSLLLQGNKILPTNSLIRGYYAISLSSWWGGSYKEMQQFIDSTKAENVPPQVVMQLEALQHEDIGHTLQKQKQFVPAMMHFRAAMELAEAVGGTFASDYLPWSRYYACRELKTLSSCH